MLRTIAAAAIVSLNLTLTALYVCIALRNVLSLQPKDF